MPNAGKRFEGERLFELRIDELTVSIHLKSESVTNWRTSHQTRQAGLHITADSVATIGRVEELAEWFRILLTFLTGEEQVLESLSMETPGGTCLLVSKPRNPERPDIESRQRTGARFSLLGDDASRVVENWFKRRDDFKIAAELVSLCWLGAGMLTPFDFVALAQAAEGLDRRLHPGSDTYMSEPDYEQVACTLISAIPSVPSALRQSLKKRLQFGNQFSLRRRLRRLRLLVPDEVRTETPIGHTGWVDDIVNLRNDLTHRPLGYREPDGQLYINSSARLSLLMQSVMLATVGVRGHHIERALMWTAAWGTARLTDPVDGNIRPRGRELECPKDAVSKELDANATARADDGD